MNAYEYLQLPQNVELKKQIENQDVFFCDFETLTDENLIEHNSNTTKQKTSGVYLWGMSFRNAPFIWGTELNDFWNVFEMIIKKEKKGLWKNKGYFINLSWDWSFLSSFINDKYKRFDGDYAEWKKMIAEPEKYDGWFHTLAKNDNNVISVEIITHNQNITISCLNKKTNMTPEKMGKLLGFDYEIQLQKVDYNKVKNINSREWFWNVASLGASIENSFEKKYIFNGTFHSAILANLKLKTETAQKYFLKHFKAKQLKHLNNKLSHTWINYKIENPKLKKIRGVSYSETQQPVKIEYNKIVKKSSYSGKVEATHLFYSVEILESPDWLELKSFDPLEESEMLITPWEKSRFEKNGGKLKIISKRYFLAAEPNKYIHSNYLTWASIAFNGLIKYVGYKQWIKLFGSRKQQVIGLEQYQILSKSFRGGITNFNPKLKDNKKGCLKIDINSSYPSEMVKELPYGKALTRKPKNSNYVIYRQVEVERFEMKEEWVGKIPPLIQSWIIDGNTQDERYLYSYKNKMPFFTTWLDDELKMLLKYYNMIYKTKNTIYFKSKKINSIANFIKEMFHIKSTSPNESIVSTAKLQLNSLYGKFSQSVYQDRKMTIDLRDIKDVNVVGRKVLDIYDEGEIDSIVFDNVMGLIEGTTHPFLDLISPKITFLNFDRTIFQFEYKVEISDNDFFGYKHVGAKISASARIKLVETIEKIGYERIKYFATDSIYFETESKEKGIQELKELGIELDQTKLGAWKVEGYFTNMKILGANKYRVWENEKWKYIFSGVSQPNKYFEANGHELFAEGQLLKSAVKKRKRTDNGFVYELQDYQIGKAIQ